MWTIMSIICKGMAFVIFVSFILFACHTHYEKRRLDEEKKRQEILKSWEKNLDRIQESNIQVENMVKTAMENGHHQLQMQNIQTIIDNYQRNGGSGGAYGGGRTIFWNGVAGLELEIRRRELEVAANALELEIRQKRMENLNSQNKQTL